MKRGQTSGRREEWYENGNIKRTSQHSHGVCLSYAEWDDRGNVTKEKKTPTKEELELIKKLSSV